MPVTNILLRYMIISIKQPGVYGTRFSGAGYRGCCIGLIDPRYKETIKEKVTKEYIDKYPHLGGVFEINFCKTDDGARIL